MELAAPNPVAVDRVAVGRLLLVGMVSAIVSAIANALVFVAATSSFGGIVTTTDEPVTFGQVVVASVAGGVGAVAVFAIIGRFTRHPIRVFWGVATVGLLISFIPIVLVGATGPSAGTLALMHVVAAAIDVFQLARLAPKE